MYKVGLIGYGAFGKSLVKWLSPYCEFTIYDSINYSDQLGTALNQPIIVLAIPAQFLDNFLQVNKSLINRAAIYIDVCSVKVEPTRVMLARLPESAQIISSHPVFGPESAKAGLKGEKVMIHPTRVGAKTYKAFKDFLEKLQLSVIEITPEAHDRDMAYVQSLSHYIGRIMQELDVPDSILSTQAYRYLLDIKNVQGNDSDDLFNSIVHSNPFSEKVLSDFKKASKRVDKRFHI